MSPTSACKGSAGSYSCQCPTSGESPCGNSCVDLSSGKAATSPIEDCGACGITCLAGATCSGGECSCPSASTTDKYCDEDPNTGATDGNFMCIEVTTTKSCGACGAACLDDSICQSSGAGTSPADFACECVGNDAGKTHCPGEGCRDTNTDADHCGSCGHACDAGQSCCGGGCVDLSADAANCGTCGHACASNGCGGIFGGGPNPQVCKSGNCGCP